MATTWQKQVKGILEDWIIPDKIIMHKNGTISVWRSYFYHHGQTSKKYANAIMETLNQHCLPVELIEDIDDYKNWPKESYFKIKIKSG